MELFKPYTSAFYFSLRKRFFQEKITVVFKIIHNILFIQSHQR